MVADLLVRFMVGGVIVSAFAILGDTFRPKTFAGLFGAAPSVAIATLSLTYVAHGADYVAIESRSMIVGSAAFLVYCVACVAVTDRAAIPAWLGATLSWGAWAAIAFTGLYAMHVAGVDA